jgi:hypothetical protein
VPRGGGILSYITGVSIESSGVGRVAREIPNLDAPQARAAERRLEAAMTRQTSIADVLDEEKWTHLAGLKEYFKSPFWRSELVKRFYTGQPTGGPAGPSRDTRAFGFVSRLELTTKRRVVARYTAYMDSLIAQARGPAAARQAPPPIPNDPASILLLYDFGFWPTRLAEMDAQVRTQANATLLRLALHAYRLEHGRYPDRLAALVPSYLARLPDDPTVQNATYGYRRNKDGRYTLFSGSAPLNEWSVRVGKAH